MAKTFVLRGNLPLVFQLRDMYPWLSEADATRIADECAVKRENSTTTYEAHMQVASHYYHEAQKLKPYTGPY